MGLPMTRVSQPRIVSQLPGAGTTGDQAPQARGFEEYVAVGNRAVSQCYLRARFRNP